MLKLSIIIPVYNVEKYIVNCLTSCIEQDIPQYMYEIIIINDGSTDNSINKCSKIISSNSNITLVNQNNRGLSAARNKGLSLAKGEYIWFVDSDDWIQKKSLSHLLTHIDSNIDILLISAANVINGACVQRFSYAEINKQILNGSEIISKNYLQVCAPFSIYKRAFLEEHNLNFMEGIIHEDLEFSPRSYYKAKKVSYLNEIFYYVRQNPTSLTRTLNAKKSYDLIILAKSLENFTHTEVCTNHKICFFNYISLALNIALNNILKFDKKECKKWNIEMKNNKELFKYMRKSSFIKYKIEGVLFELTTSYSNVYRFFKFISSLIQLGVK